MKIIQVVSMYPPHLGGMENCVREISERLAKSGNQVEIFTSDVGSPKNSQLRSSKNLKIHYLKGFEVAHTPIIPSLFIELFKIPKDSIVHVHVAQVFIPEIVSLVCLIRKIPYLVHVHTDVGPSGKFGFLLPLYKKLILRKILSAAKRIIVLTSEYKGVIDKKYHLSKNVEIIPNGVNEGFFTGKEFLSERINLLYVGRLTVEKNVDKLIKAVLLLKNDFVFNIVGSGEKKEELDKLVAETKLKNIILHGKKTGEDLINFYKKADIFLLASDYEGLPLVLLEAMASGTPVIASGVLGIREFVGDAGVLVDPPTSENFAKAIDGLIKNKELKEVLNEKGREKAKKYQWNKIVEKIETVYREIQNESN